MREVEKHETPDGFTGDGATAPSDLAVDDAIRFDAPAADGAIASSDLAAGDALTLNSPAADSATTSNPSATGSATIAAAWGPVSRRKFLALTGGTAALAAGLSACGGEDAADGADGGSPETAPFGEGDVGVLNFLLTFEHLEADLFAAAIASGLFKGAELETLREVGAQEAEHIAALTDAIEGMDGEPASKPKTKFNLGNAKSVLKSAATVENLAAAAYLGQLPNIASPEALALALSIQSVEGRHATAINTLAEEFIAPDGAFGKPLGVEGVFNLAAPFLVGDPAAEAKGSE